MQATEQTASHSPSLLQGTGALQPLVPELEDELLLEDDELLLDDELLEDDELLLDDELLEDDELLLDDELVVEDDELLLDEVLLDDVVIMSPLLVLVDDVDMSPDDVLPLVVGTAPPTPPPPAPPTSVLRSPPCAQLATITPKITGKARRVKRFMPGRIVSGIDLKRKSGDQLVAITSSTAAASLGTAAVRTTGSPSVQRTSSSMRMPRTSANFSRVDRSRSAPTAPVIAASARIAGTR
jgi:hypothetical protein